MSAPLRGHASADRSFKDRAKSMFRTQDAMTKQVGRLEENVGHLDEELMQMDALLEHSVRSTRHMSLLALLFFVGCVALGLSVVYTRDVHTGDSNLVSSDGATLGVSKVVTRADLVYDKLSDDVLESADEVQMTTDDGDVIGFHVTRYTRHGGVVTLYGADGVKITVSESSQGMQYEEPAPSGPNSDGTGRRLFGFFGWIFSSRTVDSSPPPPPPTPPPTSKPAVPGSGAELSSFKDDFLSDEELLEGSWLDNVRQMASVLADLDWNDPSLNLWEGIERMWSDLKQQGTKTGYLSLAYFSNQGSGLIFPYFNFVSGFPQPTWSNSIRTFFECSLNPLRSNYCHKWNPAVQGEKVGVVTYNEYALRNFKKKFPYPFFDNYYTGSRVPSWEDNENHANGIKLLDLGVEVQQAATNGAPPTEPLKVMEPRFAFDTDFSDNGVVDATWNGFPYAGPRDIKYASNGVYGIDVVNKLLAKFDTTDALGVLMSESVFSVHLVYYADANEYRMDLSRMANYTAIEGYASLGGKATFVYDPQRGGRLRTTSLTYGGITYTDFEEASVERDFANSVLTGWRFAEKAIIASLLSQTNLVLHVKDLHLEIAAAFQAGTIDAFASDVSHPVRRIIDPFIHRSVQATNDNFKLLFNYFAAEFSLAPLPSSEQLRLIQDAIDNEPLFLDELDMENYGKLRNIPPEASTLAAYESGTTWFWRWHYRSLTVQRLYEKHIRCWLAKHYGGTDSNLEEKIARDEALQAWWGSLIEYIPSLKRSVEREPIAALSGGYSGMRVLTSEGLVQFLRTMMVWLSWIHEDVGHAASSYVYNPVHTPMCVPQDGKGIPMFSFLFNTAAYRGFVFLERAKLLDDAPEHWFDEVVCTRPYWWWPFGETCSRKFPPSHAASHAASPVSLTSAAPLLGLTLNTSDAGPVDDKSCFTTLQDELRVLGETDPAFSECDENGFYSCVARVETAVSS